MKIAIFGGSFDPPHNGHRTIIRQSLSAEIIDEIWIIPVAIPPFKIELNGAKTYASDENRLAMCQLLKDKIKNVKVLDVEIKRHGKSYSLDTVRALKKRYPSYHFYFLIGSDWVKDLTRWYKADELFKEIQFISLPRTMISSSDIRNKIKKHLPITGLVPDEIEDYIKENGLYI